MVIAEPKSRSFHFVVADQFASGADLLKPQVHPEAFESAMSLAAENLDPR